MQRICECGCGRPTELATSNTGSTSRGYKAGEPQRFIHGHNRHGLPSWNKGLTKETNEILVQHSEFMKDRPSPRKGQHLSIEQRQRLSDFWTGKPSPRKGQTHTEAARKKLSEAQKKKWMDREYVLMMANARNIKPNKPETLLIGLLDSLYPGEWKYTGDFSMTINGKCPDFVNCNGQKKIIEFNGSYWHQDDVPGKREAIFAEYGYETLIIWDKELKNMESIKSKIQDFHEKGIE